MAKNKVEDWSAVSANNGDIAGLTLGVNMPPSYVNNAMQEMMAQIKQMQNGAFAQPFAVNGTLMVNESKGSSGQVVTSTGATTPPVWKNAFTTGMVVVWYGSAGAVPSGWAICDGSNGTPNLRNKFVMGANTQADVNKTGGRANSSLPEHSHTGFADVGGEHTHSTLAGYTGQYGPGEDKIGISSEYIRTGIQDQVSTAGSHTHTLTVNKAGEDVANGNLPPYLALYYIMKL